MPAPAFANIQQRAEESALARLANARLACQGMAFDVLLAMEMHPLGLYGEMGELRHTARVARSSLPFNVKRDSLLEYDPLTYSVEEIMAKVPASFHVDAAEPYNTFGVRLWLRA